MSTSRAVEAPRLSVLDADLSKIEATGFTPADSSQRIDTYVAARLITARAGPGHRQVLGAVASARVAGAARACPQATVANGKANWIGYEHPDRNEHLDRLITYPDSSTYPDAQ